MKKHVGNIIDIENNEKIKSSKGYEYWATKHNLKTAADTVLLMRKKGFKSISQLCPLYTSDAADDCSIV